MPSYKRKWPLIRAWLVNHINYPLAVFNFFFFFFDKFDGKLCSMLITAFAVNLPVPEIRSASRKDGSVITDLGNMVVDVRYVDV